jgi:2,4-dienoyl-CoA reductase-like NADH-dependent reductase (Old Yellow Enzyme family)
MAEAVQVRKLRDCDAFRAHLEKLGLELPFDEAVEPAPNGALAAPIDLPVPGTRRAGNRFCILPMEGWDGTLDGRPTELVERRWRRFGASGAKLIWGGEAVAVRHDGRANPHQLRLGPDTVDDLARLRSLLVETHSDRFDTAADLVIGLQLTHSGRWARPDEDGRHQPRIAYRHPVLDTRVGASDDDVLTDDELDELGDDFIAAAKLAAEAGFDFVDVKCCHGYLGHELLSGLSREGRYGGDLSGRTRFLRGVIEGIANTVPTLGVGVRISVFDFVPFVPGPDIVGTPEWTDATYPYAFGADDAGLGADLTEPEALLGLLADIDVRLVCVTAGSPYYNPHIQRPAFFPPSDGYTPPEDPLVGVARLLAAAAELKRRRPDAVVVGSGYSYLQEWLPNVAQAAVRSGNVDSVGLGRMVLSYPGLPADVLAGQTLDRRHLCRTFSDCTTAPRNGLVSGCYPLDEHYKGRPDRRELAAAKKVMVAKPARAR